MKQNNQQNTLSSRRLAASWSAPLTREEGDSTASTTKNASIKPTLAGLLENGTAKAKPRRRTTVSFAPLPPPPFTTSTSLPSISNNNKGGIIEPVQTESKGFRNDYTLGDTVRSESHMLPPANKPTGSNQACQSASSLQKHDFAFVRRSDGSYAYAILAFRSLEQPGNSSSYTDSLIEYMSFVISGSGSTKMLKKKQWSTHVRLASMEGLTNHPRSKRTSRAKRSLKKKDTKKDDTWSPPSIISFIPSSSSDDNVSCLISV